MAASTPPIPKEFFLISYVTLAAAVVWSAGGFLASRFLSKKKVEQGGGRRYRAWQITAPAILALLGAFWVSKIYSIQIGRDLLEMNGVLVPAGDADPRGPCDVEAHPAALKIYLGGQEAITLVKHTDIVSFYPRPTPDGEQYDPTVLGIDRLDNGTIALHANVFTKDQRFLARIDENHFEVSRNRLLDPFSPPRKDKSTIELTDEDGNTLRVRFINEHSVSFSGKLYLRSGVYIEIDDRGIHTIPAKTGFGFEGPFCWNFINATADWNGLVGIPRGSN